MDKTTVETPLVVYRWMLPDPLKPGRMYRSRWSMTEEEAAQYPGATRIDETREVRQPIGRAHSTSDFSKAPGGLVGDQ